MTDTDDDLLDDLEADTPKGKAPKALREAYDKQKADLEALRKENEELRSAKRRIDIASALKKHEAPERLAKYAERDLEGEVSDDAVLSWLTTNGEDFGWEAPGEDDDGTEQQAERLATTVSRAPTPPVGNAALLNQLQSGDYAALVAAGLVPAM